MTVKNKHWLLLYPKEQCSKLEYYYGNQFEHWLFSVLLLFTRPVNSILLGQQTQEKQQYRDLQMPLNTFLNVLMVAVQCILFEWESLMQTPLYRSWPGIFAMCVLCAHLCRRLSCPWWRLRAAECSSSCLERLGQPPDTAARTPPTKKRLWHMGVQIVLFF